MQTVEYYPFGGIYANTRTTSLDETRKFIGEQYDDSVALSYLNARYYDGARGGFLSEDPEAKDNPDKFLSDPQQLNSYSYARNNPLALRDPSGKYSLALGAPLLFSGPAGWIIAGGLAIAGGAYLLYEYGDELQEHTGAISQPLRHMLFPHYDSSGDEPRGLDPKLPNWQKGIGIGIGILGIGTTVYCVSQGSADCVEKVENSFAPNNNSATRHSSNNRNSPTIYTSPSANTYGSMSIESRREAAANYNASISPGFVPGVSIGGALAGTHWVLSNGTVVTWEGELVSGPTAN